jgi:hypothetical protein
MERMLRPSLLITLAVATTAADPLMTPLPGSDCAGTWIGRYAYDQPGYEPVVVSLVLADRDGTIEGAILEANAFGPQPWPALTSTVAGSRSGTTALLRFTYDGRNGVGHTVDNCLILSADGTRLGGTWSIGGDWTGTIALTRVARPHGQRTGDPAP